MYFERGEECQESVKGWGYDSVMECLPNTHEAPGQFLVVEDGKDSEH